MNFIKCEKLEKSMAELQFSIDAEAFKKAVADVFKKEGKKYAVPGFRKGKAPRALIEKNTIPSFILRKITISRSPPASNIIIRAAKYPLWCEFCPKKERAG